MKIIYQFADGYIIKNIKNDYYCGNASPMKSNSLYDAKQECQNNPSCKRFYNNCGDGIAFYLCEDSSSDIFSHCGSVLYSGGNIIAGLRLFHI